MFYLSMVMKIFLKEYRIMGKYWMSEVDAEPSFFTFYAEAMTHMELIAASGN